MKITNFNLSLLSSAIARGGDDEDADNSFLETLLGDGLEVDAEALLENNGAEESGDGENPAENTDEPEEENSEEEAPAEIEEEEEAPVVKAPKPALKAEEEAQEEQPPAPTKEELAAQREEFLENIASQFAISDDDVNMLLNEPEKILPMLGARIYEKAVMDMAPYIQQQVQQAMGYVPTIVTQHTQQQAAAQELENSFFSEAPGLVAHKEQVYALLQPDASGRNVILEQARIVAGENAKTEDIIKVLGRTVSAMLGVDAGQNAPVRKRQQAPVHRPASAGTAATQQPASDDNSGPVDFITELLDID